MFGWVTRWWVSVPIVGALGAAEVVLTGCPIVRELVEGMGTMVGTGSSMGGKGPQVTRLALRFGVGGSEGSLWEGSESDVGVLGWILGRDVGCRLNSGKKAGVLLGRLLTVWVDEVAILTICGRCCGGCVMGE